MPFQTPPTFNDGDILSAAQLNLLSDDLEYLNGLISGRSFPFAGSKGNAEVDIDDAVYYTFHAHRYLFHRFVTNENLGTDVDSNVLYFVDWGDSNSPHLIYAGTTGQTQSGSIDMYDPQTWPNAAGAWASSTVYDADKSTNWNGTESGEIVTESGNWYKCIQDHTSGPSFGTVGVHWSQITNPTVGNLYKITFELNFDAGVGNQSYDLNYYYESA